MSLSTLYMSLSTLYMSLSTLYMSLGTLYMSSEYFSEFLPSDGSFGGETNIDTLGPRLHRQSYLCMHCLLFYIYYLLFIIEYLLFIIDVCV